MALENILQVDDGPQFPEGGLDDFYPAAEEAEDGGFGDLDLDTDTEQDFHANLAKWLDESALSRIATNVCEWVEQDERSRQDWEDREARGIKMLGVTRETVGGAKFKGASRAVHPGLIKACIQFQARAVAELWPSGGPVKTVVMGDVTPEREEQAKRVADFMNWQYTTEMPGGFDEHDRLLMRLPMTGSGFKKVSFDHLEQTVVSRFVESSDLFVPYSATDLRTAPRFTHRMAIVRNDLRKLIAEGVYLDVVDSDPVQESYDHQDIDSAIDDAEGRVPTDSHADTDAEQDQRDKVYECYCYLDLEDYRYSDQLASEGFGDPYTVTVHRDDQVVLSIRRGWKEGDPRRRRRMTITHYKFLPGLGFYGFGLFHIAGGLSMAQTGALRSLLDAAMRANFQGGYRSRDLKIETGEEVLEPGVWKAVDASAEDLKNGFFTPPYPEPSRALMELLGWMDGAMDNLVSTTESMVGDDNKAVPVGTTLARIEQGLKVFSGIHRRGHTAQKQEFGIVADLNSEHMPEEYPYDVPNESRSVFAADFDERVDVEPVSDPNIITNTQRLVTAEAIVEKATQNPDLYNRKAAHRNYLEALRVADVDSYIEADEETPRQEPVGENMAMMEGRPVQVFPDQDHLAHAMVHRDWFLGLPKELQEQHGQAAAAHMAEHGAQHYRLMMGAQVGIDLPSQGEEVPPEVENQIAEAVAEAMVMGASDLREFTLTPLEENQGDPELVLEAKAAADIERKNAMTAADIKRKDAVARSDQERKLGDSIAEELIEATGMAAAMKNAEGGRAGLSDIVGKRGSR